MDSERPASSTPRAPKLSLMMFALTYEVIEGELMKKMAEMKAAGARRDLAAFEAIEPIVDQLSDKLLLLTEAQMQAVGEARPTLG